MYLHTKIELSRPKILNLMYDINKHAYCRVWSKFLHNPAQPVDRPNPLLSGATDCNSRLSCHKHHCVLEMLIPTHARRYRLTLASRVSVCHGDGVCHLTDQSYRRRRRHDSVALWHRHGDHTQAPADRLVLLDTGRLVPAFPVHA